MTTTDMTITALTTIGQAIDEAADKDALDHIERELRRLIRFCKANGERRIQILRPHRTGAGTSKALQKATDMSWREARTFITGGHIGDCNSIPYEAWETLLMDLDACGAAYTIAPMGGDVITSFKPHKGEAVAYIEQRAAEKS